MCLCSVNRLAACSIVCLSAVQAASLHALRVDRNILQGSPGANDGPAAIEIVGEKESLDKEGEIRAKDGTDVS